MSEVTILGQKFGSLTAVQRSSPIGIKNITWEFLCDCGNLCVMQKGAVKGGHIKTCVDCGHKIQNLAIMKHGMYHTREYNKYTQAKTRCNCPTNDRYKDYGGRGIEFRFESFKQFFAELGECPADKTLDRIDNDGHYESGNVRWATSEQQYGPGRRRKRK